MTKRILSISICALIFCLCAATTALHAQISSVVRANAALGPDEGISGPMHKKYLDQIVFAKGRIMHETMNNEPETFKKKFTLGETIYARVFLSKPFASFPATNGYFHVTLEVDGANPFPERFCYFPEGHPAAKFENKLITTFQFSVIPAADDKYDKVSQTVVEVFNKLTPGDHLVKATVWTNFHGVPNPTVIMTGSFTLTVPAGGAKIKGISFETLKAGMADPALSAQILSVVQKYATANSWTETHRKVKIINQEWRIGRNDLTGRILGRDLSAWVYATWPDGHCTYQVFGVKESYDGANYSKIMQYNGVGDQTKCDCIK